MQRTTSRVGIIAALLALGCALAEPAFARGGRGGGGGGMRAGGGGGMRAGGGGVRSSASTSMSRGGQARSVGSYQRPSGGYNRGQAAATRPAAGANRGQIAANRPAGGYQRTGDRANQVNRAAVGNRVNTGDINRNINIDNDGGWGNGWGGWNDHPVATGVAFGTAAAVTAAALSPRMYAMPPSCAPYPYGGYSYYNCGGTYYESRYEGDTVVYVTVPAPE